MPATRKDVAALAGVSTAVVSYVVNGGPRPVSAAARTKVVNAIEALGYRPDGLGRSLRTGSSNTIALMVPDASNPFFAQLARAVEDEAFGRGLAVLVCNSADDSNREASYLQGLADRRVDGLIFISAIDEQDFSALTDLGIPVVTMDRGHANATTSSVRVDNRMAAYLGTSHLLDHGHARVALIGGPRGSVADQRRAGWLSALTERGVAPSSVSTSAFTFAGGQAATLQTFGGTERPTAVLVSSDAQAIGALHSLSALGLAVPNDVAVVSIDGTELAAFTNPPLTTVSQPIVQMAQTAVQRVIDLRRDGVRGDVEFDPALIVRRTCGCIEAPQS